MQSCSLAVWCPVPRQVITVASLMQVGKGAAHADYFKRSAYFGVVRPQLSGPNAVVIRILVENSHIESAIEVLKSGRVLDRVIDEIGLGRDQVYRRICLMDCALSERREAMMK
jgi:hypothetical protein